MFGRRAGRGQASSEYMLVISVVTVAVVGAALAFVPSFRNGTLALGADVQRMLGTGETRDGGVVAGLGATGAPEAPGGAAPGLPGVGTDANGNATHGGLGAPGGMGAAGGVGATGATGPMGPTGPGGNTGSTSSSDTRHSRSRGQFCVATLCIGVTREVAVAAGTGGHTPGAQAQALRDGQDLTHIKGAWKSYIQDGVAKAAAGASKALADKPLCGVAVVAALTGRSVDQAYRELESNGRLAMVKQETVIAGVVTSTKYTTTGVMRHAQLLDSLRHDYGLAVRGHENWNVESVKKSLGQNKQVVVLYDDGDGDGKSGHFGVVTDVNDSIGVKVDTATGSFWIPRAEFERRMSVMGGRAIEVSSPPGTPVAAR